MNNNNNNNVYLFNYQPTNHNLKATIEFRYVSLHHL